MLHKTIEGTATANNAITKTAIDTAETASSTNSILENSEKSSIPSRKTKTAQQKGTAQSHDPNVRNVSVDAAYNSIPRNNEKVKYSVKMDINEIVSSDMTDAFRLRVGAVVEFYSLYHSSIQSIGLQCGHGLYPLLIAVYLCKSLLFF